MRPDVIDPQFHLIENERSRREAWVQAIGGVFMPTLDKSVPFPRDVEFRCWKMGPILLSSIRASAQTIERTRTQIATQSIDHVVLRLYASGRSSIDTGVDDEEVPTGSLALYDLSQRSRSVSHGMSGINVGIPRRMFDARVGEVGDLHRVLHRQEGRPLVRLLSDHLINTSHCLDGSDEAERALLATATVALCNAALTPATDSGHNRPAVMAIEVRQFIEAHLGRRDLGVEMLRARFGLSRTPLYEMFEAEGGVATYIRNRRLALAMRILSGVEKGGPRRVSSIAYACGYENLKSFSKAFRDRYGVVPRDVDRTFMIETRWETQSAVLSWIKDL